MTQADAKYGHLAQQLLGLGVSRINGIGVAGAVAQEHTIGVGCQNFLGGSIPGHYGKLAAHAHQVLQNAQLGAAVVRGDAVLGRCGLAQGEGLAFGQRGKAVGFGARNGLGQVDAHDGLALAYLHQQALVVGVFRGEHRALSAVIANVTHQGAGVNAFNSHNAVFLQELGQALGASPVAGGVAHVAHHQAAQGGLDALAVALGEAVVANLRIGHGNNLAGIRGVGDDLQIAFQRGVEANLAEHFAFGAAGHTFEAGAVFKHQKCLFTSGFAGVCQQFFRSNAH